MPRLPASPPRRASLGRRLRAGLALGTLFLAGCRPLPTDYGRRVGDSVNGTGIFAAMCVAAGAEVTTQRRWLPGPLEDTAVVVWFDLDFGLPDADERRVIETWLDEVPGRTLLYVGRGYDAEPDYWDRLAETTEDPAQAKKYRNAARTARAKRFLSSLGGAVTQEADWEWAETAPGPGPTRGKPLRGDADWIAAVGGAPHAIDLSATWQPNPRADVPLAVEGAPVVIRESRHCGFGGRSRLFLVPNGSFLLNLPLHLPAHRRLAGKLIEDLRDGGDPYVPTTDPVPSAETPARPRWVFLETDRIVARKLPPGAEWAFLGENPIGVVLQTACGLGLLILFGSWPILGRAKTLRESRLKNFGLHVEALGRLLRRTRDLAYSRESIRNYDHLTRNRSPAVPAPPGVEPPTKSRI